jgi:hypothetical protein
MPLTIEQAKELYHDLFNVVECYTFTENDYLRMITMSYS